MLYLVATPIGNLADITYRAVSILQSVNYILCEDTRHSLSLLRHYDIHKPLKSYHRFNEAAREEEVLQDLRSGQTIALISDAGTPGIADPGARLVKRCREENLEVIAIPGACAAIQALSCSGLDTDRFQFFGFLPRKSGELRAALLEILRYGGTTVCYESPLRLITTLTQIKELAPDRLLAVGRELTKKFEENLRGNAEELLRVFGEKAPRGEVVLLIAGESVSEVQWEEFSAEEHVRHLEETYGVTTKEAIKMAAEMRGIPKSVIYNKVHNSKKMMVDE